MVEFRRSSCKNAFVFVSYKDTFTKNFLQICLASALYGIVEYGLSKEFLLAFDKRQRWLLSSTCVVMQIASWVYTCFLMHLGEGHFFLLKAKAGLREWDHVLFKTAACYLAYGGKVWMNAHLSTLSKKHELELLVLRSAKAAASCSAQCIIFWYQHNLLASFFCTRVDTLTSQKINI